MEQMEQLMTAKRSSRPIDICAHDTCTVFKMAFRQAFCRENGNENVLWSENRYFEVVCCSLRKVRNERVYVLVKFEKYEVSIQRGVLSLVMSRREILKKR